MASDSRRRFLGVQPAAEYRRMVCLGVTSFMAAGTRRHRQQPRRAEPELATGTGDTGKTDYTQSQTLSSQARTTTGI
jgi:hypothetical protein